MLEIQTYENMKDLGEGWIGKIPSHWATRKLKQLFHEKRHTQNMNLNCGSISFGEVVEKGDNSVSLSTKKSYQEVLKGEFLVNPLNLNYDLKSLRIALSDINVVVSAGYIVLNSDKGISKKFFKYLLHRYDVAFMKLLGSGVRQTISFNHIANSTLILPPLPEQKAIADFLDRKTGQIDAAVAIKQKQVELLKERKQILIQNAVTQGLNSDATMRDSGVEWIGKIPKHWGISKAKHYATIFVPERTKPELNSDKEGYPWITTENLKSDFVDENTVSYFLNEKAYRDAGSRTVKPLSVLATCVGNFGIASINENYCVINQQIQAYESIKIMLKYFLHLLRLQKEYFVINATATTIVYVNKSIFGNLPILIPDKEEQTAIVAKIEKESAKIDQAIALNQQQIAKLKEYKTTLINSAVTGKIKVVDSSEGERA